MYIPREDSATAGHYNSKKIFSCKYITQQMFAKKIFFFQFSQNKIKEFQRRLNPKVLLLFHGV